ncbi:uncharacterized protein LOC111679674 [Lucilia cuprina]|uniref:uncharacterized protein LOC111679674 n=1 Tax=Lucilia cuprina TaxID=7375 RepID=UPI001F0690B4|nr:uncharacterized protein LOC111679674 [Lucilia cuprina]
MLTPPNEEDALAEVYYLTQETTKNWRKLLKYGETLDVKTKRKLLWLWPTEKNFWEINKLLRENNITNILSIGCGNGLFEWLLKEVLNLQVYGLEVDRQWWLSNYAIKSFIPLNYMEDMKKDCIPGSFLQKCCVLNSWNFALMFCYFNNRSAFLEYLKIYEGNYIIIVGPLEKTEIYTDPLPLEPNFPEDLTSKWTLIQTVPIKSNNILVLYGKNIKSEHN